MKRFIAFTLLWLASGGSAIKTRAAVALPKQVSPRIRGIASWYNLKGRRTASKEIMDPMAMTCAHRFLRFGQRVRVRNRTTHKCLLLRVNDRGPYIEGRVLDVTKRAAELLGFRKHGVAFVEIEVLG